MLRAYPGGLFALVMRRSFMHLGIRQAIYPTLIIFIVALNRSEIDGTLANATPSDISTSLLPSMLFRGSTTAIHLSPSTDYLPDTERALDSLEDRSDGEEGRRPQEKPEEAAADYLA